jgi:hypothetical protein
MPRINQVTPHSGQITPHSGLFTVPNDPASGQFPQHVSHMGLSSPYHQAPPAPAPDNRSRNIALGVAAALLIALIAAFFAFGPSSSNAKHKRLDSTLAQVQLMVERQDWGQAQIMLDGIHHDLSSSPELMARGAQLRKEVSVGQLMVQAETSEKSSDLTAARSAYQKVLELDPRHPEAQARLASLATNANAEKPQQDPAKIATLKIDCRTKARVTINDDFVGYTPVSTNLPPGTHHVEVSAKGFSTWTHSVTLDAGQTEVLDAELDADKPAAGKYTWKPKPKNTSSKPDTKEDDKKPEPSTEKPANKGDGLLLDDKKPANKSGDLLPMQ